MKKPIKIIMIYIYIYCFSLQISAYFIFRYMDKLKYFHGLIFEILIHVCVIFVIQKNAKLTFSNIINLIK